MSTLYQGILMIHAVFGLFGLIVFWIPVALKKGSPKHKQIGNWFVIAMMVTGSTGLMMALLLYLDPIAARFPDNNFDAEQLAAVTRSLRTQANFFLLLGLLLMTSANQAKQVLIAKQRREIMRLPRNLILPVSLLVSALYLLTIAISERSILFGAFAGLGLFGSTSNLWYAFKPTIQRFEWVIEHLGGALGGGIAAHTAFFVFGANRLIGGLFTGQLALIPWLAPSVIGITGIVLTTRHYRKKYGHYPAKAKLLQTAATD